MLRLVPLFFLFFINILIPTSAFILNLFEYFFQLPCHQLYESVKIHLSQKNLLFLYISFLGTNSCSNLCLFEGTGCSIPFTIYPKEVAVALKWSIFDPMLVKPKCIWEAVVFWKIVNKRNLALPRWGQICVFQCYSNFFRIFFKWNTL